MATSAPSSAESRTRRSSLSTAISRATPRTRCACMTRLPTSPCPSTTTVSVALAGLDDGAGQAVAHDRRVDRPVVAVTPQDLRPAADQAGVGLNEHPTARDG